MIALDYHLNAVKGKKPSGTLKPCSVFKSLRSLVTSALVWNQVPQRPVLQTSSLSIVLQGDNAPTRRWVLMGI